MSSPPWAPWPRWWSTCACPAAATPWLWPACTAASRAPPTPTPRATCAWRSRPHPDDEPVDGKTRNLEREYRAVVEEILELRGDDGRIAAFVRSITEPGALADTSGYSPDISLRPEGRAARDARRDRAPGEGARSCSASAWPRCRCARRSATTCSRARRSSSASTSCASRWSRSARSWARTTPPWPRSTARRSRKRACPRPCASRPRRSSTGSSAWASSRARAR